MRPRAGSNLHTPSLSDLLYRSQQVHRGTRKNLQTKDSEVCMKRLIAKSMIALAALTGISTIAPGAATADNFHVSARHDHGHDHRHDHHQCVTDRRWIEPVYEEKVTRVWCEPVYETRYVAHWVKPYYKTVVDRVWVEPIHETRKVVGYDRHGHKVVRLERVCVRDGGWKTIERQEFVPGHTKHEPEQVLVRAGHYDTKRERVCVREGRWETVACNHPSHRFDGRERERFSVNLSLGGLFK